MRQKKKNGFRIMQEGDAQKGDVQKGDAQKGQTSAGGPPVDSDIAELDMQVKDYRKKVRRRMIAGIAAAILVVAGVFAFICLQTYTSVTTIDVYAAEDAGNSSYREFAKGVLKYSRDGISLLNRKGEEEWNQSYQMENPSVYTFEDTAVVADKGGNDMIVVDKEGVKGEIETTLPIEKAVVSSQGIVAAVLKGDDEPCIMCYDAAGNILAKLDTSITGNGYPLDISLSENGELLLVSYMTVQNGRAVSNIYYYNFGDEGNKDKNYEVLTDTYEDMVAPTVFFMDKDTSVTVGSDRILIYKGEDVPELTATVELKKEIKSVFHSSSYIGLVLKNEGEAGYELCLYNKNGSKVMSEKFTGDYSNVKICGMQVIMYDGTQCSVYTRTGIHKFEGEMDDAVLEIFPVFGVNKYLVMNANGMELVRFVK